MEETIGSDVKLDIAKNLTSYKHMNKFQTACMSFIARRVASQDDIQRMRRAFMKLDVNGTGKIPIVEVKKIIQEEMVTKVEDEKKMEEILEALDQDGSGNIDFSEFMTAAINRDKLLKKDNLLKAFKIFDQNGDGILTQDELK